MARESASAASSGGTGRLAANQHPPVGDVVTVEPPTHRAEPFVPLIVRHVTVVAVIAIDQWMSSPW